MGREDARFWFEKAGLEGNGVRVVKGEIESR